MAKAKKAPALVVKTLPVGVKIISILYYIAAAIALLSGIALIFGSSLIGSFMPMMVSIADIGAIVFILVGIVFLALAVLEFFVARGLWNGKNWARITAIVLTVIGIISVIRNPLKNIVLLVLYIAIIWYLGFTKEGKEAFAIA